MRLRRAEVDYVIPIGGLSEAEDMRLVAAESVSDALLPVRYEAAKRE